jgi:hypothetical protein
MDFTHLHRIINKENKHMNPNHDFTNAVYVAVYHNSEDLVRATAVATNVRKNTLIDQRDFDPLDFNDGDAIDEAVQKIEALIQKHQAAVGQHRDALPIQQCPKCKSKLSAAVFAEDPNDEDTDFLVKLVCFKCEK